MTWLKSLNVVICKLLHLKDLSGRLDPKTGKIVKVAKQNIKPQFSESDQSDNSGDSDDADDKSNDESDLENDSEDESEDEVPQEKTKKSPVKNIRDYKVNFYNNFRSSILSRMVRFGLASFSSLMSK